MIIPIGNQKSAIKGNVFLINHSLENLYSVTVWRTILIWLLKTELEQKQKFRHETKREMTNQSYQKQFRMTIVWRITSLAYAINNSLATEMSTLWVSDKKVISLSEHLIRE